MSYFLMSEVELFDQLLISTGLVKRVEIFAMQVLYQRLFETHSVVGLMDKSRYALQPGSTSSPATTLPSNQLIVVWPDLTHQHGLKDADRPDRVDERRQPLFTKLVPRLVRIRADPS
jgi:hypothetical protein